MFVQSAHILTFQDISIFLQIQLDGSNYHVFPPCFIKMKWKIDGSSAHKHERTLQFFTFFPAIYITYNGSARKNRAGFSHVRVCGLGQTNFPPVIFGHIKLRLRWVVQDRRGGPNWLRAYLAYGGCKIGSNRRKRLDMVMMQSALLSCVLYIIWTSCQPTTAHHFTMEKCVNVHKSSM